MLPPSDAARFMLFRLTIGWPQSCCEISPLGHFETVNPFQLDRGSLGRSQTWRPRFPFHVVDHEIGHCGVPRLDHGQRVCPAGPIGSQVGSGRIPDPLLPMTEARPKAAGVSHDSPREPKRAHLRVPVFNHTTKIQRNDPKRGRKNANCGGRRKKAKFWAVRRRGVRRRGSRDRGPAERESGGAPKSWTHPRKF